jgi:hypothetical protein
VDSRSIGLILIGAGAVAIVIGAGVVTGALSWFGRLPGDIRIEDENTRVFFPITSMLVISFVLSLIAALLRRFF